MGMVKSSGDWVIRREAVLTGKAEDSPSETIETCFNVGSRVGLERAHSNPKRRPPKYWEKI